jgi:hypothetical protein
MMRAVFPDMKFTGLVCQRRAGVGIYEYVDDPAIHHACDLGSAGARTTTVNAFGQYGLPRTVDVVSELEAMGVRLHYDVARVGPRAWGIHGYIAYDGEVLAAIFQNERDAWDALLPLRPSRAQHGPYRLSG